MLAGFDDERVRPIVSLMSCIWLANSVIESVTVIASPDVDIGPSVADEVDTIMPSVFLSGSSAFRGR